MRIWSVASAPVGAPLAMSMLGKLFVRAPAMPSIVNRPCGVELADAGDRLHDRPRALEAGATVEGARLEEHALPGPDVGTDPDHVHHTDAVRADSAPLAATGLTVVKRCGRPGRPLRCAPRIK
jgi:hypothetical protein